MKIFVDADGCPVVDIAIKIAKSNNLEVIVVKNYSHELSSDYATIITVDQAPDSVDYYIVNNTAKGDIVITQDYGLAAMVLAKEAFCINQNGLLVSTENIDGLLARRYLNREIQRKHNIYTKFKKRKTKQDNNFKRSFTSFIKGLTSK